MGYKSTVVCDSCGREALERDNRGWVHVYDYKKYGNTGDTKIFCCYSCVLAYAKKKIKKGK